MTTLQLEPASGSDISKILRETHGTWSAGLPMDKYIRYMDLQLQNDWGKQFLEYLVLRIKNEIAASLKIYTLPVGSHGRIFTIAGFGAIYTIERFRDSGYGTKLIVLAIDLIKKRNLDGILLFNEIDPLFYERFGFLDLGAQNFLLNIDQESANKPRTKFFQTRLPDITEHHLSCMTFTYKRWLKHRDWGIERSQAYFAFKLSREKYLHKNSTLDWPGLQLLTLSDPQDTFSGYALFEMSTDTLRVLELVGNDEECAELWQQLRTIAEEYDLERIRGWQGVDPPEKYTIVERDWGAPMLLPLQDAISTWASSDPCPLLELDHL